MKHWSIKKILHALAPVGFALATPMVNAASIPIANSGFEALTGSDPSHFDISGQLLDDHYSTYGFAGSPNGFSDPDAIPSWTYNGPGGAGTWNVPAQYIPAEAPEGINIAWINLTGTIHQDLNETIQVGCSYTLSVDVGTLLGISSPGYRIGLYAGEIVLAESLNAVSLVEGGFVTVSVSYDALAGDLHVGEQLRILLGVGSDYSGDQIDFDNVRLNKEAIATPVPEATPFGASVGLVAGLGWMAFRRQRSRNLNA
jgi:hypothetical protein